ncbi:MAG TPA: hypothetical protein VFM33_05155 [Aquabacterium sp.]|nr:hypothetical protein [Aquabacterium sp.]
MTLSALQDGQIFKEPCEDSPGIIMFCQGDWWHPTPERVALLERTNYYVLTAANGRQDIPFWLSHPRCVGGLFGHKETVEQGRKAFPDKVVERFEGVGGRFLRNISQDLPASLHYAGVEMTAVPSREMKTVDVISSFSPAPLKRGNLLMELLVKSGVSAYIFAHYMGGDQKMFADFVALIERLGKSIEFFHLPFDPYALMRIDGRIVVDCRPIGANSSIVANYLARARVYVHTSTTEGFSNAIMEALHNDVPVLLCEDILGPLQTLSAELPQCIRRSAPQVAELDKHLKDLLANPPQVGSIKSAFNAVLNPFEVNRRVVRGAQAWFERQGLPWKGHCLGIFGGSQSKLDLASMSAEQAYRGRAPIYNNPEMARQYVGFHANKALEKGQPALLQALAAELKALEKH